MPRLARVKSEFGGWYHLCVRVGAAKNDYPLNNIVCRRSLMDIFKLYSRVFCCDIASFSVPGQS